MSDTKRCRPRAVHPSPEAEHWPLPAAPAMCGLSRSTLYRLAAAHPGLMVKAGAATLVHVPTLRRYLASLPPAPIRAPARGGA